MMDNSLVFFICLFIGTPIVILVCAAIAMAIFPLFDKITGGFQ